MNDTPSRTQSIERRLAQRQEQARADRLEYMAVSDALDRQPDDEALLGQEAALAAKMAATREAVLALESQLADALAHDEQHAATERKAVGLERAQALQLKVAQRAAAYAAVQTSADAFVAQLEQFLADGRPLGEAATAVSIDVHGPRAAQHADVVADAARGASGAVAAALATVIRRAALAMGSDRMTPYLELNMHNRRPVTFTEAAAIDRTTLQERLA